MEPEQIEAYKKAGQISQQVKAFAREYIKPGMKLSEIAETIEEKILELGGAVAFPTSLSVDDVAAHYTPNLDDEDTAQGLLKVDVGVHVDGFIADSAITLDLTEDNRHEKIIKATEEALAAAIEAASTSTSFSDVGKVIHETISKAGFSPVRNLSGHSVKQFVIHAGETVPNYDNGNKNLFSEGAYAIEPFATYGSGLIYEGGISNTYKLEKSGSIRDAFARKILDFIKEKKKTLPFSQRELERVFGSKVKLALSQLEQAGIIRGYGKLVEKTHKPVTQAEHTIILHDGKKEIITKEG